MKRTLQDMENQNILYTMMVLVILEGLHGALGTL